MYLWSFIVLYISGCMLVQGSTEDLDKELSSAIAAYEAIAAHMKKKQQAPSPLDVSGDMEVDEKAMASVDPDVDLFSTPCHGGRNTRTEATRNELDPLASTPSAFSSTSDSQVGAGPAENVRSISQDQLDKIWVIAANSALLEVGYVLEELPGVVFDVAKKKANKYCRVFLQFNRQLTEENIRNAARIAALEALRFLRYDNERMIYKSTLRRASMKALEKLNEL